MRRARRRWLRLLLLLLLLTQVAALGGAVTLRRDSSGSLDASWPGREDGYRNGDGLYCPKCPAGSYLAEECKAQSPGRCEPCAEGEFMEYPNAFPSCQECSKCREDQVQLSPCQRDRNTVCACRGGTFCPPEHPCEMCQKCQPRCPEGQVELKGCTADGDIQCGPAGDRDSFSTGAVVGITVTVAVIVAIIGFCVWKRRCSSPEDGRTSSKGPYKMVSSMFRKLKYRSVNTGTRDNDTNEQREPQPPVTPPSVRPKWNLVPAPGEDPSQRLRSSFYIFARNILSENWKKFGRYLKLAENDVLTATSEDGVYEMLLKWQSREGSRASVNTLLATLDELHLGGDAENISSILLRKGLFQHGAAGSSEQAAPPSELQPSHGSHNT